MPTTIRPTVGALVLTADQTGKSMVAYDPTTLGTASDGVALLTAAQVRALLGLSTLVAITVPSPGASENATIFYTTSAFTITKLESVLVGSSTPSVTWTLKYGASRASGTEVVTGGTTTTSTTTGSAVTSLTNATVPANVWFWLETTAQSGTVGSLAVSVIA